MGVRLYVCVSMGNVRVARNLLCNYIVFSSVAVGFCNAKIRCSFNDQIVKKLKMQRRESGRHSNSHCHSELCTLLRLLCHRRRRWRRRVGDVCYQRFSRYEQNENFSHIDVCRCRRHRQSCHVCGRCVVDKNMYEHAMIIIIITHTGHSRQQRYPLFSQTYFRRHTRTHSLSLSQSDTDNHFHVAISNDCQRRSILLFHLWFGDIRLSYHSAKCKFTETQNQFVSQTEVCREASDSNFPNQKLKQFSNLNFTSFRSFVLDHWSFELISGNVVTWFLFLSPFGVIRSNGLDVVFGFVLFEWRECVPSMPSGSITLFVDWIWV